MNPFICFLNATRYTLHPTRLPTLRPSVQPDSFLYDGVLKYTYDAWNRLVKATKAYRESPDSVGGVGSNDTCGLSPEPAAANRRDGPKLHSKTPDPFLARVPTVCRSVVLFVVLCPVILFVAQKQAQVTDDPHANSPNKTQRFDISANRNRRIIFAELSDGKGFRLCTGELVDEDWVIRGSCYESDEGVRERFALSAGHRGQIRYLRASRIGRAIYIQWTKLPSTIQFVQWGRKGVSSVQTLGGVEAASLTGAWIVGTGDNIRLVATGYGGLPVGDYQRAGDKWLRLYAVRQNQATFQAAAWTDNDRFRASDTRCGLSGDDLFIWQTLHRAKKRIDEPTSGPDIVRFGTWEANGKIEWRKVHEGNPVLLLDVDEGMGAVGVVQQELSPDTGSGAVFAIDGRQGIVRKITDYTWAPGGPMLNRRRSPDGGWLLTVHDRDPDWSLPSVIKVVQFNDRLNVTGNYTTSGEDVQSVAVCPAETTDWLIKLHEDYLTLEKIAAKPSTTR